jgi:hypothetical protein
MRARGLGTAAAAVPAAVAAAVTAAVAAVGIALACVGCGHAVAPSSAPCWQTAVRLIERHVVVRSVPPPCAALSQAQLNHVVASAIRAAAGPHPKAVQRRIAASDARYLGSLVQTGPPAPSPPSLAQAGGAPLRSSPAARLSLVLAALGCWAATGAVGGYLLAGHRRTGARPRKVPAIAASHAGIAVGGLAVWAAFAVGREPDALGWCAAALLIGAAGLGLAVLLSSPSAAAPAPASAAARAAGPQRTVAGSPTPHRVLVIAAHAALAVVTILLVLLAATGGG